MIFTNYQKFVLNNVPRLLSQLDRNKYSVTYGCFDRNHWHYKIRDFSSIVLQQGTLALALLYSNQFEGNIYFKNEKIKEWIIASLDFWTRIQHKDGSYDEYWPHEHGYPPTVFSLFSSSESIRILENEIDDNKSELYKKSIIKACKFISNHDETGAQNQEIASVAALYSSYLLTSEKWLLDIIEKKLITILRRQSKDGWFSEYGGADIGYLSVSLCYLAEYYRLSKDERVIPALHNTVNFLQYFIHPDGTVGGEYGTRNTEYFLINGLEILAPEYPIAGAMADKLAENIFSNYKLPESVDDRYLSHYFLHSHIRGLLQYQTRDILPILPCDSPNFEKYFDDAKILIKKNEDYFVILSLIKGVIKVYAGNNEIYNDCGYLVESHGKIMVTNWVNNDTYIDFRENKLSSASFFFQAPKQIIPSPFSHMFLRISSRIFGKQLIPILKNLLITKNKSMPVKFYRTIEFLKNKIVIEDIIESKYLLESLNFVESFSQRYVPSAKYFQSKEINRIKLDGEYKNLQKIKILKTVYPSSKEIIIDSFMDS